MQHGIDIEALKKDENFQRDLAELERKMRVQKSLDAGYKLLGMKLAIEANSDEINDIFTFLVNESFDILADRLLEKRGFNLDDPEDLATIRAIYEHGLQRYSEKDLKGSKEIFLVLSHTIGDNDLKDSMMIHACAVMAGYSFEEFIDKLVDSENIDYDSPTVFLIQNFTQPKEILLGMFSKYVNLANRELEVLKENKNI
jgi:hypothetical protein